MPYNSSFDIQQLSIEAWVNLAGGTNSDGIVEKTIGGAVNTQYNLFVDYTGGAVFFRIVSSSGIGQVSAPISHGQWVHVVGTYSSTGILSIYINGNLYASAPSPAVIATGSGPLLIGGLGAGYPYPLAGKLDEVALYPTALSAARVLTHYQLGVGTFPWVWASQTRVELFTSNARGQQTTATDPEGNLTVTVRYPFNDPDGQAGYTTPGLSHQQYGYVKEIHVDADPGTVMTLVGADGDMIAFIGNKIPRTNTPGVYQNLVTSYEPSSGTGSGCSSCAYDPLGNPLSMTDPRGFTTTYSRNELGEAYRTTTDAPYSQMTEMYFDANRNVTRTDTQDLQVLYTSTDPSDPDFAQFTPSGSGSIANLPTRLGPGGSVRPGWFSNLFIFDPIDNKIEEDIDATGSTPASLVTTFGYDFNQNVILLTKPQSNTVEYDYDERNMRIATRVGGPMGSVTIMAYDGNGNPLDVIGPATRGSARQTLAAILGDAFNGSTAVTFSGDWVTQNAYDGFDRLVNSTDAVGGMMLSTFDPGGRTIASQTLGAPGGATPADRSGNQNTKLASGSTRYDEAGRAYESQQDVFLDGGAYYHGGSQRGLPSGRIVTHTGGGLAANATANNHTQTITLLTGASSYILSRTVFDRMGRTINTAADNAAVSSYSYDGASRQISMTDALGNQSNNTFDGNGNVVVSTRVERCTIPGVSTTESFASQMRYDLLNRLIVTIQQGPDGNIDPIPADVGNLSLFTYYGYDSRGNRTNLVDPKGNTTIWTYDGASRQLTNQRSLRTGGVGTGALYETVITTSMYDGNGRLIKLTDDNGGTTTWAYDTLDRQYLMTFYDGSTRTSTFDPANDVIAYVDENGSTFANTFDVLGRKTGVVIALATGVLGTTGQSFQYDGLGRMTFARDSVGTTNADVSFIFDSVNRLLEEGQSYGN